ncbi:MAG: helix-turn-helix transcriptional regulator [Niabella sp.]
MSPKLALAFYREYKNWSLEDVARELHLSTESYQDIERGRVKINGIIAQKLSDLYQAPMEFFL